MHPEHEKSFDTLFKLLVKRTCYQWEYPFPDEEYFLNIYTRLPVGLRLAIAYGCKKEIILDAGQSRTGSAGFRPRFVSDSKGPYSWFERDNSKRQPRPTWEYYVQVAEYVRLYESFNGKSYELRFEDDLMDIGIYRQGTLEVCCEVKVTSSKAQQLVKGIREYETASFLPKEDRGIDELRKAKYISKLKPLYFYVVSIGRRYEFRVDYPEKMQFKLVEDFIPFI